MKQKSVSNQLMNKRFYFEVVFYVIYFALSLVTIMLKRVHFDYLNDQDKCVLESNGTAYLASNCSCAYLYPDDPNRVVIYSSF